MPRAEAKLMISGRVQGVFYRAFTQDTAVSLGLKGWVRNTHDGRVEALMQGERSKIEQAIAKCKQGPPASHVTDVDVEWADSTGQVFRKFEIRYY